MIATFAVAIYTTILATVLPSIVGGVGALPKRHTRAPILR